MRAGFSAHRRTCEHGYGLRPLSRFLAVTGSHIERDYVRAGACNHRVASQEPNLLPTGVTTTWEAAALEPARPAPSTALPALRLVTLKPQRLDCNCRTHLGGSHAEA